MGNALNFEPVGKSPKLKNVSNSNCQVNPSYLGKSLATIILGTTLATIGSNALSKSDINLYEMQESFIDTTNTSSSSTEKYLHNPLSSNYSNNSKKLDSPLTVYFPTTQKIDGKTPGNLKFRIDENCSMVDDITNYPKKIELNPFSLDHLISHYSSNDTAQKISDAFSKEGFDSKKPLIEVDHSLEKIYQTCNLSPNE